MSFFLRLHLVTKGFSLRTNSSRVFVGSVSGAKHTFWPLENFRSNPEFSANTLTAVCIYSLFQNPTFKNLISFLLFSFLLESTKSCFSPKFVSSVIVVRAFGWSVRSRVWLAGLFAHFRRTRRGWLRERSSGSR